MSDDSRPRKCHNMPSGASLFAISAPLREIHDFAGALDGGLHGAEVNPRERHHDRYAWHPYGACRSARLCFNVIVPSASVSLRSVQITQRRCNLLSRKWRVRQALCWARRVAALRAAWRSRIASSGEARGTGRGPAGDQGAGSEISALSASWSAAMCLREVFMRAMA